MTSVSRRFRFSASHRLHSAAFSDAENARVFGKCNNPFGHGHNYVLEVTASGPVDPTTGLIVPLCELDALVEGAVFESFDHRSLNQDVPEFRNLIPTTENLALVISERLQQNWTAYLGDSSARLSRVHLQETERNSFELPIPREGEGR